MAIKNTGKASISNTTVKSTKIGLKETDESKAKYAANIVRYFCGSFFQTVQRMHYKILTRSRQDREEGVNYK